MHLFYCLRCFYYDKNVISSGLTAWVGVEGVNCLAIDCKMLLCVLGVFCLSRGDRDGLHTTGFLMTFFSFLLKSDQLHIRMLNFRLLLSKMQPQGPNETCKGSK